MIAFDGYLDGDNRVRDEGHTFVALCTAHQTTIYLNQKDSFTVSLINFTFHTGSIKPCKDIFLANKQNGTFFFLSVFLLMFLRSVLTLTRVRA